MKTRHVGRAAEILLVTLASVLAATTAIADLRDTIEKSFPVAPGGWLNLETDKGAIEVQTSPEPRVDVLVELHADTGSDREARKILDKFSVDIGRFESEIRVEARFDSDRSSFWDRGRKRLKVRFIIQVPQQYNLTLRTSGGDINVADIEGDVSARSSGGSLRFGNITGSLDAMTSGGSIRVEGCTGIGVMRLASGTWLVSGAKPSPGAAVLGSRHANHRPAISPMPPFSSRKGSCEPSA